MINNVFAQNTLPLSSLDKSLGFEVQSLQFNSVDDRSAPSLKSSQENFSGPLTFAEKIVTSIATINHGNWQKSVITVNETDMMVWRLKITAPEATSLNLGFEEFYMPEGANLFVYNESQEVILGPYSSKDNEDHGQLWTPLIENDKLIIELNIPASKQYKLKLKLSSVNRGFIDFNKINANKSSESCNIDIICPEGLEWNDQSRSVAVYSINGTRICSGAAINNQSQAKKAYFLTADHCGLNSSNAPSVVAYWDFQNTYCRLQNSIESGRAGDGKLNKFNTGAIFLASNQLSDMALIEFDDPIAASHNVFMSGWDRSSVIPQSAVAIHHPSALEKRISIESDPLQTAPYLDNSSWPSKDSHFKVFDWDLGTTEPGSSGSPLFNDKKRIIGQLHGGFASCSNSLADWYGRFNVSWQNGQSKSARLKDWLGVFGSNVMAINGINYNDMIENTGNSNNPGNNNNTSGGGGNGQNSNINSSILILLLND